MEPGKVYGYAGPICWCAPRKRLQKPGEQEPWLTAKNYHKDKCAKCGRQSKPGEMLAFDDIGGPRYCLPGCEFNRQKDLAAEKQSLYQKIPMKEKSIMTIQKAIENISDAIREAKWGDNEWFHRSEADQALGFLTGILHGLAVMHPEIKPLGEFAAERSCGDKE